MTRPTGGIIMQEFQKAMENLAITDSTTLVLHAEKDQYECDQAKQDRSDALSVLGNIQAIIERFELPTVIKRGNRWPKPIADSGDGGGSETVSDQGTGQEGVAKRGAPPPCRAGRRRPLEAPSD